MLKPAISACLILAFSYNANAQDCVMEYIDEALTNSISQSVSSEQLATWKYWCSKGYPMDKLDKAVESCVSTTIRDIRQDMGEDYMIKWDMSAEIQNNCRTAFFQPKTNDKFTLLATIDDPDGYTNVRSDKNAKSQIITRVNVGEQFTTYHQQGSWWQIKTADGKVGYIHTSRLRLID